MKKKESTNRKWSFLLLMFFLLGIGIILYFLNYSDSRRKTESTIQNKNKQEDRKSKKRNNSAQKPPNNINTEISFSQYKDIYNESSVAHEIEKRDSHGETAAVEFVFLWQKDDGSLSPFPVNGYRFIQYDMKKPGEDEIVYTTENEGKVRFLLTVGEGKYQGDFNQDIKPGSKYVLKHIFGRPKTGEYENYSVHDEYWYPIKIPKKEKLTFTDDLEELKKNAYRIPILVNEVIKTDYLNGVKRKLNLQNKERSRKVTITGVKENPEKEWNTEVQYLSHGREGIAKQPDKDGDWTVKIQVDKQKNKPLSGSVAVYRVLNQDYFEDQQRYNARELFRMGAKKKYMRVLLKYRKNVRGSRIDMSRNLDFHRDRKQWIERTINVGKHIRKRFEDRFNRKLKPPPNRNVDGSGVALAIQDPNNPDFQQKEKGMQKLKPYIAVSTRLTFWENGKLKATLKAPEGTYNLIFNKQFALKNYHWPPE